MIEIPVLRRNKVPPRTITFEKAPPPKKQQQSLLLPRESREILVAAAQSLPRSKRVTAINRAINEVRKLHPQLFVKEI